MGGEQWVSGETDIEEQLHYCADSGECWLNRRTQYQVMLTRQVYR